MNPTIPGHNDRNKSIRVKGSFVLIGLMSLSFGSHLKAQETADLHRVEFGFRFMPTISAFNMQTSSGGTIKGEATLGYGFGAALGFNFTKHVGMHTEVIYNSLSQKYKDQDLDREFNVRYINIPLLISFNTGKSNPVNLSIVAGPQLGLNIGSSIRGSGGSNSDTLTAVLTTKKGDFGFAYGAALEFALNETRTIRMDIGFRGVYGFANISDTKPTTTNDSYYILDRATVRTNAGYLGFTFLF